MTEDNKFGWDAKVEGDQATAFVDATETSTEELVDLVQTEEDVGEVDATLPKDVADRMEEIAAE